MGRNKLERLSSASFFRLVREQLLAPHYMGRLLHLPANRLELNNLAMANTLAYFDPSSVTKNITKFYGIDTRVTFDLASCKLQRFC
jgi:hypothetical protein